MSGPATIPFRRFAAELGVVFQIVDDILDVTGDEAEIGKPRGSDERHGKATYVSVHGLERARELARESHARARAALAEADGETAPARADRRLHPHPHRMTKLLDRSTARRTSRASTTSQLQQVAQEVRELIIETIGEIGGHFGANLGACEIAVALHSLLDSPTRQDPLGRRPPGLPAQGAHRPPRPAPARSASTAGLAPFCSMHESEHDIMGAGHASTSVSYAVGLKEAMRRGAARTARSWR